MQAICRECGNASAAPHPARCPSCGSPRFIEHAELHELAIAHIDCDAFYATVEKRDNPEIADKPVVVGRRKRGVVMACCYIARTRGLRSAMPMYQALKLCPDAVVIRPDMQKYSSVGREVRELMRETTPLVEPLSVDEAFLDLNGTERLHHGSPAQTLVRLVRRIETEIGVTASVGLSYNKFLAKTASDLDKPRGFAVIGKAEVLDFLGPRPVASIWGVGNAMQRRLKRDGINTVGQLRTIEPEELVARYGVLGRRLSRISHGEDARRVNPHAGAKSVSSESTFGEDLADRDRLAHRLWPLCEKVAKRLKNSELAAGAITLKMKTSSFQIITRSRQLGMPTQLAEVLYQSALPLLDELADGRRYRLIGIGTARFADPADADQPDLLGGNISGQAKLAEAVDAVRKKFGDPAIVKGRSILDR